MFANATNDTCFKWSVMWAICKLFTSSRRILVEILKLDFLIKKFFLVHFTPIKDNKKFQNLYLQNAIFFKWENACYSYLCNKGVWSKKRVRFKNPRAGEALEKKGHFMRTLVLHQIPVLHTKFFVTCGCKRNFKKSPAGLQLRETRAVMKNNYI